MKLVVFLCYIASGQCERLPWTGNPNDPHLGAPMTFKSQEECEQVGQFRLINHGGHYPRMAPGYDIRDFRCEPG